MLMIMMMVMMMMMMMIIIVIIIMTMMMMIILMMMMMMMVMTTATTRTARTTITMMMMMMMMMTMMMMIKIAFKGANRYFYTQSPHCAAKCLEVRTSGHGAIACKSRTTHRALIKCNMSCATWYNGTAITPRFAPERKASKQATDKLWFTRAMVWEVKSEWGHC